MSVIVNILPSAFSIFSLHSDRGLLVLFSAGVLIADSWCKHLFHWKGNGIKAYSKHVNESFNVRAQVKRPEMTPNSFVASAWVASSFYGFQGIFFSDTLLSQGPWKTHCMQLNAKGAQTHTRRHTLLGAVSDPPPHVQTFTRSTTMSI